MMAKDHHVRGTGRYHIRVTKATDRARPTSPTTVATIGLRIGRVTDPSEPLGPAGGHREEGGALPGARVDGTLPAGAVYGSRRAPGLAFDIRTADARNVESVDLGRRGTPGR